MLLHDAAIKVNMAEFHWLLILLWWTKLISMSQWDLVISYKRFKE